MKIHHLNCVSTCPLGGAPDGRLFAARSSSAGTSPATACCWRPTTASCSSTPASGCATCATRAAGCRGSSSALVAPDFREEMTAIRQIERLGFDPRDVRAHRAHAPRLRPRGRPRRLPARARVHLLTARARGRRARRRRWLDRQRFRPQQWSTRGNWLHLRRHVGRALDRLRLRARPRGPAAGDPARPAARATRTATRRRGARRRPLAAARRRRVLLPRARWTRCVRTARRACASTSG